MTSVIHVDRVKSLAWLVSYCFSKFVTNTHCYWHTITVTDTQLHTCSLKCTQCGWMQSDVCNMAECSLTCAMLLNAVLHVCMAERSLTAQCELKHSDMYTMCHTDLLMWLTKLTGTQCDSQKYWYILYKKTLTKACNVIQTDWRAKWRAHTKWCAQRMTQKDDTHRIKQL